MKKLIALLSIGLFVACNSEPNIVRLKRSLESKEKELSTLQTEIDSLTAQIARMDTSMGTGKVEKLVPVEVRDMTARNFEHFVRLSATVSSKENVLLSAESNGRVVSIEAKEGSRVRKGDVILRLESDFIEGQLQEAEAAYKLAETTYNRRARLWKDSIGSEIEFLNAETNYKAASNRLKQVRAQYENTFVKAPVNGTVDGINVNEGEFVGAGAPVARVVDLSNLELETEISERYLKSVKKGDYVNVSIPALGLNQEEKIIFTSQYINPENRSFMIKVGLNNSSSLIKPNLLAELRFRDYQNPEALVVPSMAILKDLEGDYVYVIVEGEEGSLAKKQYIERGASFSDETEILGGLNVGDLVVVAGYNSINDGQLVDLQ